MSITSMGACVLEDQKNPVHHFKTRDINNVSDIEGTSSSAGYKYSNKPKIKQSDIPGSSSKPLTHTRNTRDLSMYLDDIEGTRHSIKDRMMRTGRHVNPLVPDYPLPTSISAGVPEVKFLRDSMNISDIEGSSAKPLRKYEPRDNMSTSDIVGAQACWKPDFRRARLENPPHDSMYIGEIDLKQKRFQDRGKRKTNLMEPKYNIYGVEIKDDERHSKPKPLKKQIPDNHILKTQDIDGAMSGWRKMNRREYRNTMITSDVPGAQADSVKHSIQSNRLTNPLAPVYSSLDGEVLVPLTVPLLPSIFVDKPTLKAPKKEIISRPSSRQSRPNSPKDNTAAYSARSYADTVDNDNFVDCNKLEQQSTKVRRESLKIDMTSKNMIPVSNKSTKDSDHRPVLSARAVNERQKEIDLVRAL